MFEKKMTSHKENIKFLEVSPEEFIFFQKIPEKPFYVQEKKLPPKRIFLVFGRPPKVLFILEEKTITLDKNVNALEEPSKNFIF